MDDMKDHDITITYARPLEFLTTKFRILANLERLKTHL